MDPMEALKLLDQIVMQVPMTRPQHMQVLQAAASIRKALTTPKSEPQADGDNS